MITRTLINSERPLVAPNGDVLANVEITFQLVDEDKRQPVMLMDAAADGGNLVVGETITATTDDNGLFTVELWPNNRGDQATLYKVSLPSTRIVPFPAARLKPFYIKVVEGSTPLQLVEAKAAVEAASPQVLSLFDQLLQNILDVVGQATSLVTTTANGLMSFADKVKLDGIDAAAYALKTTTVNGKALAENIVLSAADLALGVATSIADGLMSAADKVKLDAIVLVGEGGYTSLKDAVAAAASGSTIKISQGFSETLTATIPIDKNLSIISENRQGVTITGPADLPIFTGSGTVKHFVVKGAMLVGGAGASQCLKVPNLGGGVNWSEARVSLTDNEIKFCGAYAIDLGDSQYMHNVSRNIFRENVGAVTEGYASDAVIEDNYFIGSKGTNPVIRTVGGAHTAIRDNVFVRGASGTVTAADIELNPTVSYGRGGQVFITSNKFGSEGELVGRPKIRTYNVNPAYRATDVRIIANRFAAAPGAGGNVAIQLDNPFYNLNVSHNHFDNYETIIADNFAITAGNAGNGVFTDNDIYLSNRTALSLFANGGRGFTKVDSPNTGDVWGTPQQYELREVRNRLPFSSDLTQWAKSTGVTVTAGQADPYGGAGAFLVARDGAVSSQSFSRALDVTGFGGRAYIRFWARAAAPIMVQVGLRDMAAVVFVGPLSHYAIGTEWKEYIIPVQGLTAANAHTLYFYIAGTGAVAGSIYLYAPQVSDYPSDYLPTTGAAGAVDTSIGRQFNRPVKLAGGGFVVLPTFADNAAAQAGGLTAGRMYKTATGIVMVVH